VHLVDPVAGTRVDVCEASGVIAVPTRRRTQVRCHKNTRACFDRKLSSRDPLHTKSTAMRKGSDVNCFMVHILQAAALALCMP